MTLLAAKLARIEYSITFHGWPVFFDPKYSRIKEKVQNARFTRAIGYFCRSQLMMFSETDDPSPFKIVHCGIDLDKYRFRLPRKEIKKLFCVARLAPEKGHAFLLHALKLLMDDGYQFDLVLAGDGPSRGKLENLANELGLSARVTFLGFVGENEIIQRLEDSDLFVLPSFVEGIPVCVMEALAVGVPVIATNIAGTGELIDHGRSGLLVPASDFEALADAVVKMIEDYDFRLSAAELGRKKVVDEFDVKKETEKLNRCLLGMRA